ncbi:hypothetical protein M9H77_04052 [Catharanthus roseus]|uniref:Uncharacterized protein n=1 Tax=Catharanthus roseus TaxID=4058 RepID=A0ACC0CD64_CATRO|nr:hypothetical protein M9H77_04052 [Catharanthus roseus]
MNNCQWVKNMGGNSDQQMKIRRNLIGNEILETVESYGIPQIDAGIDCNKAGKHPFPLIVMMVLSLLIGLSWSKSNYLLHLGVLWRVPLVDGSDDISDENVAIIQSFANIKNAIEYGYKNLFLFYVKFALRTRNLDLKKENKINGENLYVRGRLEKRKSYRHKDRH